MQDVTHPDSAVVEVQPHDAGSQCLVLVDPFLHFVLDDRFKLGARLAIEVEG